LDSVQYKHPQVRQGYDKVKKDQSFTVEKKTPERLHETETDLGVKKS
jgi:hypothetical protein